MKIKISFLGQYWFLKANQVHLLDGLKQPDTYFSTHQKRPAKPDVQKESDLFQLAWGAQAPGQEQQVAYALERVEKFESGIVVGSLHQDSLDFVGAEGQEVADKNLMGLGHNETEVEELLHNSRNSLAEAAEAQPRESCQPKAV